ncbi:MAG: type II secretion system protein GspE [Candidatus Omnitrophica bacterium CG11_big_fil_rev_8_21_14_0_20_45_26]|uniref:Type II secretion system protein GspE n=1 Tax=Candidatus Abzuiibacterium crystallinum TaxID=1974748 RepID=A0A2H0LS67_9BACT|nr:MAG: type II secretion system protein GspE [Candidatus Omnitrophica bacterium CG11_big_fil_rev_8_21_14_0_20_45_26]PIW64987.1 MAG: type II secretion system protein GspE [Candidatus Omnitrophica bacterium CG12_big_fil_rev_8_21_14_0_65_45_16]
MTTSLENCLIRVLKAKHTISDQDLNRLTQQHNLSGTKLSSLLVEEGLMNEKELTLLLSEEIEVPFLSLNLIKIQPDVVQLISRRISEQYEIIPIAKIGKVMTVGMTDPINVFAIDDLKELTGCVIRPVIITFKDYQAACDVYYSDTARIEEFFESDEVDADSIQVSTEVADEQIEVKELADQAPVIRMVNLILQEAIKRRASDIHFEPYQNKFRIRYRIDGVLREAFTPPRQMYGSILARLKIVSDLDITEKRLPQDGRFKAQFDKRQIDFRVSLLPTYHGEKAVLRVLDKSSLSVGLSHLGFTDETADKFNEMIKRPYGMILVTGPTGSGKSTTLYAILNEMNTNDRNIMTIEDPVEYQVKGITQTQVHPEIGLTFANGLRSLLRQSPDIILVGEIRDVETADIAVKAALTGHLLFSTLHTNTAAGTITRLMDMGIEPFLIASSLISATAQRLLRRICPNCREATEVPSEVLTRLDKAHHYIKDVKAYRGRGCTECNHTGYRGRIAAMEILVMDDELQQMVIDHKSSDDIEKVARRKGMHSLFENALETFKAGNTTLEEVLRVITSD